MLSNRTLRNFVGKLPRVAHIDTENLFEIERALETTPIDCDPFLSDQYAKLLPAYLAVTNDFDDLCERFQCSPVALRSKVRERFWVVLQTITDPKELFTLHNRMVEGVRPLIEVRFIELLESVTEAHTLVDLYLLCPNEMEESIICRFEKLLPEFMKTFRTTEAFKEWLNKLHPDLSALVVIFINALPTE